MPASAAPIMRLVGGHVSRESAVTQGGAQLRGDVELGEEGMSDDEGKDEEEEDSDDGACR